jgi:hypothetical protein
MHVRVCPEYDEEYRSDIAVCADCGGELVDRQVDEHGREIAPAEPAPVEPGAPMRVLFSGTASGLRELADALVASGVPFQLVPEDRVALRRNEGVRLILVVEEADAAGALAALAPFHGRGTELGFSEHARTWGGDGHEDGDAPPCPACGALVPADAAACPDCGLELGGSEPQ